MQVCDFYRSTGTFRIDTTKKPPTTTSHAPIKELNNAVFPLDCRCLITEGSRTTQYMLGSSCKSEHVYVERGVWTEPCADMLIILSDSEFMTIKSYAHHGIQVPLYPPSLGVQPKRHSGETSCAFDKVDIDIRLVEGRELTTNREIVEAGLARKPLVSQTEWTTAEGVHVLIEYPVRVWNYNEREYLYQLDTGPVLIPSFDRKHQRQIEVFERAYIAHNCPEWAEFIVNVPTKVSETLTVDHYSESRRLDHVTNRMIEVIG